MTSDERTETVTSLAYRVGRLEHELDAIGGFGWYARLYAGMAVAIGVLSFLPPLHDVTRTENGGSVAWRFGSLWDMAVRSHGHTPLLFALILVTLVVLLLLASIRSRRASIPAVIGLEAAVLALALLAERTISSATPTFTSAGVADVGLLGVTAVVGFVHAIQLRRRDGSASASG